MLGNTPWTHEGQHRPVAVEQDEAAGTLAKNARFQTGQVLSVQARQDPSLCSAVQHMLTFLVSHRFWWLWKGWVILGWPLTRFRFQYRIDRHNGSCSLTALSNPKLIQCARCIGSFCPPWQTAMLTGSC